MSELNINEILGGNEPDSCCNPLESMSHNPISTAINSSTSIHELEDKLAIIENAAGSQQPQLTQAVKAISEMINDGASLTDIKTSEIR